MEILMQFIGLSLIPLLGILVWGGISEIFAGLREHYGARTPFIVELPFKDKAKEIANSLGYRKINTDFCRG